MTTPPIKGEATLRSMDREELIEYTINRQQAAYDYWQEAMGRDL